SISLMLFGSAFYLIFDPLSLLTRTSTVNLFPFFDFLARATGDFFYIFTPLQGMVDSFTNFLSGKIIFDKPLVYQLQLLVLVMFLFIIGLSFIYRRFWCRHLCPLGAFLGFLGRFSLFGRVVDKEKCIKCLKCEDVCPLDSVRKEGLSTDKTRCQLSFECADVCPTGAIKFGIKPQKEVYNPSRRTFLLVSGLAILNSYYLTSSISRKEKSVGLIRPPGAREENAFLSLCCRCGQCMKVCPTNVLQPSLTSGGFEGIFTPELNFKYSYCAWHCNECSKICPTGAIELLSLEEKRKAVIGRAYIDKNRCIPWVDYTNCLVCEELCPNREEKGFFKEEKVKNPDGKIVELKRPLVIAEKCIGCGICEYNCPVAYEAAINVRATEKILSTR
ncbi:MAG: 4Fe-4S binding protein, partial [Actinomycetia bacterium]|nr:4Fe-4S binding protein [Actinomycetes bacterium]